MEKRNSISQLAIPTKEGFRLIKKEEIKYCLAMGNYTEIHLSDGDHLIVSKQLGILEAKLDEPYFVRIHHSAILNLLFAKAYLRDQNGGKMLLMDGRELSVSSKRKQLLLSRLDIL